MNNLDSNNNELTDFQEEVVKKVNRKAFGTEVELTPLEASIQSRRNELNFPALQSMFGLTETELQTILDKLPPAGDCNC